MSSSAGTREPDFSPGKTRLRTAGRACVQLIESVLSIVKHERSECPINSELALRKNTQLDICLRRNITRKNRFPQ